MKKKNILKKVLLVAGLVGGSVALAACNGNLAPTQTTTTPVQTTTTVVPTTTTTVEPAPTTTTTAPVVEKFTVSFDSKGGNEVASQEVDKDSTATKPTNPNKAGNRFGGWFTSTDNGETLSDTEYNFQTPVTADIKLYAKWTAAETVVLTVHDNPSDPTATKTVNVALDQLDGETWYGVPALENPTNEYKEFAGWYLDAEFQNAVNIAEGIEEDTEIWAKWAPKYENVTTGFNENGGNGMVSWENLAKAAGFTLGTNTTSEKSYGIFTFATGLRVHDKTMMNTQGKDITITLSGSENEIHVVGQWGSSSSGKIYVEQKQADGTFTKYYTSETTYTADKQALDPIDLTKLPAGVYKITSDKTTKLTSISVVQKLEKAPVTSFEFSVNETEFLAGSVADKAALKTALGVAVNKVYGNGRIEAVTSDDEALVINLDAVNLTTEGEYTATVKYGDFEAKEFKVKVFGVDTITANMYALDSSRATKHVQTVFATGDEFNSKNLSIVAHAKCGTATKDFTIAKGFTATKGNDGVVTVTFASKTTTYQTYTLAKATPVNGKVQALVNPELQTVAAGQFKTITQALQWFEASDLDASVVKEIALTEGTYNEKVYVTLPNVHIQGAEVASQEENVIKAALEEAKKYVIVYDRLAGQLDPSGQYLYSTDGSATFSVAESATGFMAQGITFKNYYNDNEKYVASKSLEKAKMSDTQAVALLVRADKSAFQACRMTSYHDTLYADKGRQVYNYCYIEGRTDYIFGGSTVTAYFGNSTIHTLVGDLNTEGTAAKSGNGGYVACTKGSKSAYDYIFDECKFEADSTVLDGSVSLGRTWDSGMKLMIMNSEISAAYSKYDFKTGHKEGDITYNDRYTEMNKDKSPSKDNIFEYNNTGAGALSATEAANYVGVTVKTVATEVVGVFDNPLVIFAGKTGETTYEDSWNEVVPYFSYAQTAATVTLKVGSTDVEYGAYVKSYVSEKTLKALAATKLAEGYVVEGLYTNEAMTTKFDATKPLTGNVTLYVKSVNSAALQVSATTYNFDSQTKGDVTTTIKVDEVFSIVNASDRKGSIAEVSSTESAVDGPKKYKDANGTEVTAQKVYKTGGQTNDKGRYFVVDLTKFTGKAVIEILAVTGSKDATGRHAIVATAVANGAPTEAQTLLKYETTNDIPTSGNSVEVDCGAKYYILADASVNFYAINVKPVVSSYNEKFAASTLTNAAADKEAITQAELGSFFKLVGTAGEKRSSSNGGAVTAVEFKDAGLEFTVAADVTLKATVASTGGSNTSLVALYKGETTVAPASVTRATGDEIGITNNVVDVYSSGTSTVITWTLSAGTYTLKGIQGTSTGGKYSGTTKPSATIERPARFLEVEVKTPTAAPTNVNVQFAASNLTTGDTYVEGGAADTSEEKAAVTAAELCDGFFTAVGTVVKRSQLIKVDGTNNYSSSCTSIEASKAGGLEFTVAGTVTVTLSLQSTSGSNKSVFTLNGADGTAVQATNASGLTQAATAKHYVITGNSVEVTYELSAGTYKMLFVDEKAAEADSSTVNRGGRFLTISVVTKA